MRFLLFILIIFFSMSCSSSFTDEVGRPYRGWQEGELDIHHIYTGRGESNFYIFPDGTTMLIDAGDWDPSDYGMMCELWPDSSRRAGEWIARYIRKVNPGKDQVDYLLISHFHSDHTGDCTNKALRTTGREPDYVLTGIAETGEYIRFGKVIDRGWPDYSYPLPVDDPDVHNYLAFIQWKIKSEGLSPDSFHIGSATQIALLKDRDTYENIFQVRNLAANGRVWSGCGNETTDYYELHPLNKGPAQNENTKSLVLRIDYGPFSYYTGGDISGTLKDKEGNEVNMEEAAARVCGSVDVCKANHHAYKDAMTEAFLCNIQASAYIIPVWDKEHIQPEVMARIASDSVYPGERMIFPTRFPDHLTQRYVDEPWMHAVSSEDGHIVVKVFDRGRKYKIYVLSARNEEQIVKKVYEFRCY